METRIKLFNNIISRNNQYAKKSSLWFSIQEAYTLLKTPQYLNEEECRSLAEEFCNVISLYVVAFASGGISVSVEEFIKVGINSNSIRRRDGFIRANKKVFLKMFGFDIDMEYVENYENIENPDIMEEDTFYQMKIKSRGSGWHFIGCFFTGGVLYLSDTSNRGINVRVKDVVDKKHFRWLLKIG